MPDRALKEIRGAADFSRFPKINPGHDSAVEYRYIYAIKGVAQPADFPGKHNNRQE
ncbi:MAG: hypothetical protein M8364_10605 [Methylobacter sp.]|uniref:hypothetical protein n=1 Tax=Methylobacter sp. TaxID=2051955 RepID=UPI0025857BB6|nr:hypothetical protein [Methylobacter sp.]MCL7421339.1 hypothetical protein [Methylobacter sp.]